VWQGGATKGLEIRNNLLNVSIDAYPKSYPTPSHILPNYFAALSMEDDDDNITVVASNVTRQSTKSDDATASTESMSDDDDTVHNSLPYYPTYTTTYQTSRPATKNSRPHNNRHFICNQQHQWPHEGQHGHKLYKQTTSNNYRDLQPFLIHNALSVLSNMPSQIQARPAIF
jgi:hypothetical protein